MWPICLGELADAVGASTSERERVLTRAIAWRGQTFVPGDVFFALERRLHALVPEALAAGAVCVVHEGAAGTPVLVVPDTLAAFRRFAAFFRARLPFPVIGVGGSNGKTTTKDMIAWLVGSDRVTATPGTNNGWTGVPISICQPAHTAPPPEALVLEIGIDAPGAMREHASLARPDIAVLTALGIEHLAGLGSHDVAIREELELFAHARRRVWLASDPPLAARLDEVRDDDVVVHPIDARPDVRGELLGYAFRPLSASTGALTLTWRGEMRHAVVPVPGAHNSRNAALAIAVVLLLGRSLEDAATAIATFPRTEQRCVVRELASGTVIVDDSYNASPGSVTAALAVVAGFPARYPRVLVLGDMLDLGDAAGDLHAELVPLLPVAHVRLFGTQMGALAPSIDNALSVGRAPPDEDPRVLLDSGAIDGSVVLVKGSRGMKLERVVHELEARDVAPRVRVGVVGASAATFARALRAHLDRHQAVDVRCLDIDDLEGGEAVRVPYDIAMVTDISMDGADVERDLAALAQLFVHLREGSTAIIPRVTEDDAFELLAGIVSARAMTIRCSFPLLIASVLPLCIEPTRTPSNGTS